MAKTNRIKIWDGFVRTFHWCLVLFFILAFTTIQFGKQEQHSLIGYAVSALIIARILWGFFGGRYARFGNFIYSPKIILSDLKSITAGHHRVYLGHNPSGGAMVVMMLICLLIVIITGLFTLAMIEYDGPLLYLCRDMSDNSAYLFHSMHEYLVNIMLILIVLHLIGVMITSIQQRENLVLSMLTGYKRTEEL